MFWTPQMIKELKERGYKFKVMTLKEANAEATSTKPQATSTKLQAPSSLSNKLQASSPVAKASSFKPQASSAKIPEPGNK